MANSILPQNLLRRLDDVARLIRFQEVAVGHSDRGGVPSDQDVDPVVPFPERPNRNGTKVARSAESLQNLPADSDVDSFGVRFCWPGPWCFWQLR
jgi:hypothetical protein